jgi:predicted DNA-binding transcriptional regulator YafY
LEFVMQHPTTRVLAVLEILQARGRLTGTELAERLEVDLRTVRRYITMLQDLGIPIEGERGRAGGYRLRPGFKLPPLMLTGEEALAVTLGLLVARRMGLTATAPSVEGAIAKIGRVLPPDLRAQVSAVQQALVLDTWIPSDLPATAVVLLLSQACQSSHRVWLAYEDGRGQRTEREFDPYRLVFLGKRWYAAGHCHLRDAQRVFRVDRIIEIHAREATFEPPVDFDALAAVQASIAQAPRAWHIELILKTTIDEARRRMPPLMARLEPIEGGVRWLGYADDLDWIARELIRFGFPVLVLHPQELKTALRDAAENALAWAANCGDEHEFLRDRPAVFASSIREEQR